MIETPTTLILGAGASLPYGFPSGANLVHRIVELTEQELLASAYFESCLHKVEELQVRLKKSELRSIDLFLAYNPSLAEVGKALICHLIIGCENSQVEPIQDPDDHWYECLWSALCDGVGSWQELLETKLSVLTFNYDTSLENYLYDKFLNSFEGSEIKDADAFLNRLDIVHVFGSTGGGPLAWGRRFGDRLSPRDSDGLAKATKEIFTIGEATQVATEQLSKVKNKVASAHKLVVLGFGYHRENMDVIDLAMAFQTKSPQNLFFGAYGEKRAKLEAIVKVLKGSETVREGEWPCSKFANESSVAFLKSRSFLEETGALRS